MAGFYIIYILRFELIAKPLYKATKGPNLEPLNWNWGPHRASQALTEAPTLRLPYLEKPFTLYIAEKQGIALDVLTQKLEDIHRPVAYFSKQ